MEEQLRPCPFCGSSDVQLKLISFGVRYGYCNKCSATSKASTKEAEATKWWNMRNGEELKWGESVWTVF